MAEEPHLTKRAILERLLEQGMVLVTLDARTDEVLVPDTLRSDPQLRLNLSYKFGRPMECVEEGVRASLTFKGVPFDCFLPWDSIYMLISHATGQPFLFPADVPDDATELRACDGSPECGTAEGAGSKPRLTLVSSQAPEPARAEPEEPEPPPTNGRRPHLRVVK